MSFVLKTNYSHDEIFSEARTSAPVRTATAGPAEIIVDNEDLMISRKPGNNGRAVISFSGIGLGHLTGQRGRGQKEEFGGSLSEAGLNDHSQIFVIDRKRTWMNGIGRKVVPLLRDLTKDERFVVTLGNSMGGFAAIWVAGQLPNCTRAIATSPQFSVNPGQIVDEKRWKKYTNNLAIDNVQHAFDHISDYVDYWAFFGTEKRADQQHASLLKQHGAERLRMLMVEGGGHDVARLIKKAGILSALISILAREGPVRQSDVGTLFADADLRTSDTLLSRREARRQSRREARTEARTRRRA